MIVDGSSLYFSGLVSDITFINRDTVKKIATFSEKSKQEPLLGNEVRVTCSGDIDQFNL